jgi:hypothetical protein
MAAQQAHLHVMTINPNKYMYEQIPSYGFRGVAFTMCHGQRPLQCSLTFSWYRSRKSFLTMVLQLILPLREVVSVFWFG